MLVHADWWKKYSTPSGAAMKPKPLSVMRLIVPVVGAMRESFECKSAHPIRTILGEDGRILHGYAHPGGRLCLRVGARALGSLTTAQVPVADARSIVGI